MKRYLQSKAETLIARTLLRGTIPAGTTLLLDLENDTLVVREQ